MAVLDYGVGNLRNVARALNTIGAEPFITSDPDMAWEADRLVLPGVGAFGDAMVEINRRGLDRLVLGAAAAGKPVLGICVGFQVLFEEGLEFGRHAGLGLFRGSVARFSDNVQVPHVGWNQVTYRGDHPLGGKDAPYYYFVHSYRAQGADDTEVLGWCEYGGRFPAVIGRGNVVGVQFHPEKSQRAGLDLLRRFLALSASVPTR